MKKQAIKARIRVSDNSQGILPLVGPVSPPAVQQWRALGERLKKESEEDKQRSRHEFIQTVLKPH